MLRTRTVNENDKNTIQREIADFKMMHR